MAVIDVTTHNDTKAEKRELVVVHRIEDVHLDMITEYKRKATTRK